MTVLDIIKARMVELGWVNVDLARATGMSKQSLGPILLGQRPLRAVHLFMIDNVLNLNLDYSKIIVDQPRN